MLTGTLYLKLRPLKFAFLVPPYNKKAFLEAIKINSMLWGGFFNPIIPLFKGLPNQWKEKYRRPPNCKKIIEGYIEAFDPDYIVEIGNAKAKSLNIGNRKVLSSDEILLDINKSYTPNYGMGLFELLDNLYDKELKFERRNPFTLYKTILDKRYFLFLASLFGTLHKDTNKIIEKDYKKTLGIKDINCSISNYHELLLKEHLNLRLLTYDTISTTQPWFLRGNCVYLFDAENYLDLIDYWNIRALGWKVIPVAKQIKNSSEIKKLCLKFIDENYIENRFDCKTTFLGSRSTTETELNDFINSLSIDSKEKWIRIPFPTFWDEWDRVHNDCRCCEISSKETSLRFQLMDQQRNIYFKSLSPKQISDFPCLRPKFANEVNLTLYSNKEPFAEVFPEGYERMSNHFRYTGFGGWRFSKKQPICYAAHKEENITFYIPSSEDVFRNWMKTNGWGVELSSAGIIAKQILEQVGSIEKVNILQNRIILDLLEEINNKENPMKKEELFSHISRAANKHRIIKNPKDFLEKLIKINMFQLGATLQCPICTRHSWYSIEDLKKVLQCPKCIKNFNIPSHSPEDIKWSYKAYGPFSIPKYASGAYSVLLTLLFFSDLDDHYSRITPMLSFEAKKKNKKIEADLGLLIQSRGQKQNTINDTIFVENKSFNPFNIKDIKRMIEIGKNFPGAILVFATLKDKLDNTEKKLIRRVANIGRKYWKSGHPHNPVVVLTGNELFSDLGIPYCWDESGPKYKAFINKHRGSVELVDFADTTQQLYLDMEPRDTWLEKKYKKIMERRKRKQKE